MNNHVYILVGMQFGDEGKGTFADYLAFKQNIKQIIRYNGGSNASHTVITPHGQIHKFSQLGSGMFLDNCKTYLSKNMVVNPHNLVEEAKKMASQINVNYQNILERVFIDENCYIVTPYHKLINKLRELSNAYIRRGSVGTGVSEVTRLLNEEDLGIQMKYLSSLNYKDILQEKLLDLYHFTQRFLEKNIPFIDEDKINNYIDEREINYLTHYSQKNKVLDYYIDLIKNNKLNIVNNFNNFYQEDENALFEASQGILLDAKYGIKPNTTMLDTTNKYALEMLKGTRDNNITKIGITRSFASRHGIGVLPTEDRKLNISDENQVASYWNGTPRYGWFDAVLMRYAQSINKVDELYLSSIDKMSHFLKLYMCNYYAYKGMIDDEFKSMFDYEIRDNEILVKNIKNNQGNISKYLSQCKPVYIEIDGWNKDISNVNNIDDIPSSCLKYINLIEELVGVKVSLISVGPTRKDKIKVR